MKSKMDQELFSEINPLYASRKDEPNVFRIRIRMRDRIDPETMRRAVDTTMTRYPYFCVELQKKENRYLFAQNSRPIVIADSPRGVVLASEESNYHFVAFSCFDDWMFMDMSHALTDGTGAIEVIRTLLYYYCTEHYHARFEKNGIRLAGDLIPAEEWEDPALRIPDPPASEGEEIPDALDLIEEGKLQADKEKTVFSITIPESEFMRFNLQNDGSPATMTTLFLSRAVAALYPDSEKPIRISLCVNLRKALRAPLAHQSLVGGAWLEYKEKMRNWPLDRQATAYRGMVFVQTRDESALASLAGINRNARNLLSMETDRERADAAGRTSDFLKRVLTATVSYVGKADLGEAESYIREFHAWANAMNEPLLIEISAVNHQFTLDVIQNFSSPVYVNAFLRQLEENGIRYVRDDGAKPVFSPIRLPWL